MRTAVSNRVAVSGRVAVSNRASLPATQNLVLRSEDLTNASWLKGTGITTSISTEAGTPDDFPAAQVSKVSYDGTGVAGGGRFFQLAATNQIPGSKLYSGFWGRCLSGIVSLNFGNNIGTGQVNFRLNDFWEYFTFPNTIISPGTLTFSIFGDGSDNSVFNAYFTRFQFSKSNWLPPYVQTAGSTVNPQGIRNLASV